MLKQQPSTINQVQYNNSRWNALITTFAVTGTNRLFLWFASLASRCWIQRFSQKYQKIAEAVIGDDGIVILQYLQVNTLYWLGAQIGVQTSDGVGVRYPPLLPSQGRFS